MSRVITLVTLAAALAAAPALGQVAPEQLQGTWECYGPGQTSAKTPPIMFFGDLKRDQKGAATIEVDGFSRAVAGSASVAADADGWTKVSAASGGAVFVKGYSAAGSKVSMQLRREGGGSYKCMRLPRYDSVMIPRDRVIEETTKN